MTNRDRPTKRQGSFLSVLLCLFIYSQALASEHRWEANALEELSISATVVPIDPPEIEVLQVFCSSDSLTLLDLFAFGAQDTVTWYSNAILTDTLPIETLLYSDVFFVNQTVNGCTSDSLAIEIVILGQPSALPSFSETDPLCVREGDTIGSLFVPEAGDTILWFVSPEDSIGPFLDASVSLMDGDYYYVVHNGACSTAVDSVTISVSPPDPMFESDTIRYCAADYNLVSDLEEPTNSNEALWTLQWSLIDTDTVLVDLSDTLSTQTYSAQFLNADCASGYIELVVVIEPLPIAEILLDTLQLCIGSVVSLTAEVENDSLVLWSGGEGSFSNQNALITDYSHTGTELGFDTIYFQVISPGPCALLPSTDSLFIEVVVEPVAEITLSDTISLCSSDSLLLIMNDATTGNVSWESDIGSISNNALQESHFVPPADTSGFATIILSVVGPESCGTARDTLVVEFFRAPRAGLDSLVTICIGTVMNLDTLLVGADSTGIWMDGSNVLNVPYTFGEIDTLHFQYLVLSSGNCSPDTAEFTLQVVGSANSGIGGMQSFCENESSISLSSLLSSEAQNDGEFVWVSTGLSISGGLVSPSDIGLNGDSVNYLTTIAGCGSDEALFVLSVDSLPMIEFTLNEYSVCLNDTLTIENTSSLVSAFSWTSLGFGEFLDASSDVPDFIPNLANDESDSLIVTLNGEGACLAQELVDTLVVMLYNLPEYELIPIGCAGDQLELQGIPFGQETSYSWTSIEELSLALDPVLIPVDVSVTDDAILYLQFENDFGCVIQLTDLIEIAAQQTVEITSEDICLESGSVEFSSSGLASGNDYTYQWIPDANSTLGWSSIDDLSTFELDSVESDLNQETLQLVVSEVLLSGGQSISCPVGTGDIEVVSIGTACAFSEIYQFPGNIFVTDFENRDENETLGLDDIQWIVNGNAMGSGPIIALPPNFEVLSIEVQGSQLAEGRCPCTLQYEVGGLSEDDYKGFTAFPNPVETGELNVALPVFFTEKNIEVRLYDVTGAVVFAQGGYNQRSLLRLNLPNGLKGYYTLEVRSDRHQIVDKILVR